MIKIKVSNLANGRYDYNFEGQISDLYISEPYSGNFKTTVVLTKFDNQIILDSETGITANLLCDRCAGEFQSLIKSNYRMIYLFRVNYGAAEKEKDEIVYIHPDTDKIELNKDIRDYAILALPMKRLCSEDCKGLCPKCGKNLNDGPCNCVEEIVDPRWDPIQKMKSMNK
jgi:uncharacterized protein